MGIEKTFDIIALGAFDVASGTGGTGKAVALLSITTEPPAPFAKGSKYYNSATQKIYTAVEADTWTDAKVSDPSFASYYTYNGKTYTWDGNSLELFELEDYQKTEDRTSSYSATSTTTYPNSKALSDGLATKQDTLVSGTNIKTLNGSSILGSGNLVIDTLPSQTGNANKFLTTNGTTTSWAPMSPSAVWYTGNTGTTVTILNTSSYNFVEVFKNGLLLEYGQDYTISGTTLTLTTALVSTDKIAVKVNDITSVPLSDIENLLNNLNSGDNE